MPSTITPVHIGHISEFTEKYSLHYNIYANKKKIMLDNIMKNKYQVVTSIPENKRTTTTLALPSMPIINR